MPVPSESTPEPYTPTPEEDPALEEVRGWYIDGRRVHNPFASDAALVERFDRWLAAHDAEVAAKALRDAADSVSEVSGVLSVLGVCRALRDRAARLSSGGES